MARFRVVGCPCSRRFKVKKQVQLVEQDTYDDSVVEEVDPNVLLVAKLQKGLKLFRDIAGDSDGVGNECCVCFVYVSRVEISAM